MRIYTDYLTKESSIYTEEYIDLNSKYGTEINDINQVKLFKDSLPKHATVKMINGKLQIVPSGEVARIDDDIKFKPKISLNEVILELNLHKIKLEGDEFFKLNYSFMNDGNELVEGELVNTNDMIIYKDLRSVLYNNGITEWSHVFKVELNLHGKLAKDIYVAGEVYNDAEAKFTSYLTSMLKVLDIKVYKEDYGVKTKDEFPVSLAKLDEATKEQLKMIINKARQAKSLSMRIKLDDYGSSFVIGDINPPLYDFEITKGNLKFTDKDHVTNIEIDPDDLLAIGIEEYMTSNLKDISATVITTASIGADDVTFKDAENPQLLTEATSGYSRPVEMCKYDEIYFGYIKAIGQLGNEEEKLVSNITDSLINYVTEGFYHVYLMDENTIIVSDPDTNELIASISKEGSLRLKMEVKDKPSKMTKNLNTKSCIKIWDYLIEILKQH